MKTLRLLPWLLLNTQQQPVPAAPGIRAGQWKYAAHVELGAQQQDLGIRTVTVSPTTNDGAAGWIVAMSMELEGHPFTDSVVMLRAHQEPVQRHAVTDGTDLMLVVVDTMAHGLMRVGTSLTPLNIRLGSRSFLNYYALRAGLAELPLQVGWVGNASVLELGDEPSFFPVSLSVLDTATITVPAGKIPCWRLEVKGRGIDEQYWIGTERHDVIRTREPVGSQGAIMQLDLVSFTPTLDTVMSTVRLTDADHVLIESKVDQRPYLVSGPPLTYPDLLRQTGVEGRVLVQAIIDTMGRVEPASIRIVSTSNEGFSQSARAYMFHARFRPARLHGRAVRVIINLPIDYKLRRKNPYDVRYPDYRPPS